MEREEIERAVDALMALSGADKAERELVIAALDERVRQIPGDFDRTKQTHSLVRLMLDAIPVLALVRHLAANALRAGDEKLWSYGKLADKLEIPRSAAQEIVRRSRSKLPKA